jgi:CRISPR-associated protein Csb2
MPVFVPVNDVGVIRHPNREKLERELEAYAQLDEGAARAKALKKAEEARKKLQAETLKACAAPSETTAQARKEATAMLPDGRGRQPRTFPVAIPELPHVAFVWPDAAPPRDVSIALGNLLRRLSRLGHSSSLVHATLITAERIEVLAARTACCVPNEAGNTSIRWVSPGQIERLDRAFALHQQVQPRVLPARFVNYRWGRAAKATMTPSSYFAPDFLVFARLDGPRLPPTSVVGLSSQVRKALMSCADPPPHEVISGHGGASERPHLAIVPLPYVSGRFADGALLGFALILPRTADEAARKALLRAVARMESNGEPGRAAEAPSLTILLGEAGKLVLRRVAWGEDRRRTLQPNTWTHASRHWATATPIALDRNPGDLHNADARRRAQAFDDAAASIRTSCERIGLPVPHDVDVLRSCVLPGTAKPKSYPRYPIAASRPQRVLVHARLTFDEPVTGPVLLGSGRYFGLGLCAPVDLDS